MSSTNRATSKGGKGLKSEKSHKSEKSDSNSSKSKGSGDKQHGHKENSNSKLEDPGIKEKVKTLIEMTNRSEEEVCLALHECDNDLTQAINLLLEKANNGEWETTTVKKKKNRQASTSKKEKGVEEGAGVTEEWTEGGLGQQMNSGGPDKDRGARGKGSSGGGGPPRLHGRPWRSKEKQENDRNLEGDFHRDRRGRGGSSARGGGGLSRGRGGGRGGRYPPRGRSQAYNKPIDTWDNTNNTWDNSTALGTNHNTAEDNWDDFPGTDEWSTEEYTGSLADTKVFTPSVQTKMDMEDQSTFSSNIPQSENAGLTGSTQPLGQTLQMRDLNQTGMQMPSQSPVPMVGTLNAAQTQYLNQLQQQNSDKYGSSQGTFQSQSYEKSSTQVYNSTGTPSVQAYANSQQYGSGTSNTYVNAAYPPSSNYVAAGDQTNVHHHQHSNRTKMPKARLPPPSKIPASAVEMPGGEVNSSIGYLDVQFGAMDFMSDSGSFDGDSKMESSSSGGNPTVVSSGVDQPERALDGYSKGGQSSLSSALSQGLGGSSEGAEPLTRAGLATTAAAAKEEQAKQPVDTHGSYSQAATYGGYQPKVTTYTATSYTTTQTTSSSYVSSQSSNSFVNSQPNTYSGTGGNTYQNYSSSSSYQNNSNSSAYPAITQANSYPSSNQNYPQNASQSVYGANSGLSNSSNFGNTSTSQYNSYSSASSHKLVKEAAYDNSSSTVSSTATTSSNSSVSASSATLSLAQTTMSGTKVTTTLAAKNSNSVVSNIPPGAVMSTPYIVGQVPYFQPPVYSYEDVQLIQQRLPHMTTPYYDMSYQTPTTLAAVREAALGGYSLSDGRFTRGENASPVPVPSTLSQQTSTLTQAHQAQPILAGTAPQYFFAPTAAFNTLPNYQFGTMYTPLPAATNAHGTSNSSQYPKPTTYGSGYGAYDALNQTQDYTKGAYVSNTQGQKGTAGSASAGPSSGNDLTAMYGKTHTALGKVNSYEKQGFHSGTPPPFPGALHSSQNAGLAPSGTGYAQQVYIPTIAPHQQHHSTPLMHQPLHQMEIRHQGRHVDSGNTSGQRSQTSNQAKTGTKQAYPSYSSWNQS